MGYIKELEPKSKQLADKAWNLLQHEDGVILSHLIRFACALENIFYQDEAQEISNINFKGISREFK